MAAPPLKPIAITITITTPINDGRLTTGATERVTEKQSNTRIALITAPMSRYTHLCAVVWSWPQHPGWFQFTPFTTEPGSTSDLGSIFKRSPIHHA